MVVSKSELVHWGINPETARATAVNSIGPPNSSSGEDEQDCPTYVFSLEKPETTAINYIGITSDVLTIGLHTLIVPTLLHNLTETIHALIDTDARVTLLADRFDESLRAAGLQVDKYIGPALRVANGQELQVSGSVSAQLMLGGRKFQAIVKMALTRTQVLPRLAEPWSFLSWILQIKFKSPAK